MVGREVEAGVNAAVNFCSQAVDNAEKLAAEG